MPDELFVLIDAADRTTRVANRGWRDYWTVRQTAGRGVAENTWVCPVGGVVMLQPLQLLPDFRSAGNTIPRATPDVYTVNAGSWFGIAPNPDLVTDFWIHSDGTPNASLTTKKTYEKNQAYYFSTFVYAGQSDNQCQCKLYFGEYTLKIFSDGYTELYVGAAVKDTGYLTNGPTDMSGQCLDVVIVPYKRDSILFWSQTGGSGWVYRNIEMISSVTWNDASQITAAGKVTVTFPNTAGRFQLMPLLYATEGTFFTGLIQSILPPTADQQSDTKYSTVWSHDDSPNGHTSGVTGAVWDAAMSGPFTADGTVREYTGRWGLIGDGYWTPFVYALTINWPSITSSGIVDELDVTDDVTALTINIAEDASQSTATLTLRYADSKYPNLARKTGRHCIIRFGTMEVFWGVMKTPEYTMDLNDLSTYQITIESIFRWFESPNLPACGAWDGYPHTRFVKWMVTCDDFGDGDCSWPATEGSPLPYQVTKDSPGQWKPESGDSKKSWISKVTDLTGWVFDDWPDAGRMKLRYIDPTTIIPTTQAFVLESSENPSDFRTWIRTLKEQGEEPEATQVWVVGCTEDTKELMAAVYIDYKAEDGTLIEDERPDNWMGRVLPVRINAGHVKSLGDLEKLAYYIGKDVTRKRTLCSIDAEYIPNLWRNDLVTFLGETWKILSINITCERECDDFVLRPATYSLELIDSA